MQVADNILLKGLGADVVVESDVFLDDDIQVESKSSKSRSKITTKMSDHYGMWLLLQHESTALAASNGQCKLERNACLRRGNKRACEADYHLCLAEEP